MLGVGRQKCEERGLDEQGEGGGNLEGRDEEEAEEGWKVLKEEREVGGGLVGVFGAGVAGGPLSRKRSKANCPG